MQSKVPTNPPVRPMTIPSAARFNPKYPDLIISKAKLGSLDRPVTIPSTARLDPKSPSTNRPDSKSKVKLEAFNISSCGWFATWTEECQRLDSIQVRNFQYSVGYPTHDLSRGSKSEFLQRCIELKPRMLPTKLPRAYRRSYRATHDLPTFWHASLLRHLNNLQLWFQCPWIVETKCLAYATTTKLRATTCLWRLRVLLYLRQNRPDTLNILWSTVRPAAIRSAAGILPKIQIFQHFTINCQIAAILSTAGS